MKTKYKKKKIPTTVGQKGALLLFLLLQVKGRAVTELRAGR